MITAKHPMMMAILTAFGASLWHLMLSTLRQQQVTISVRHMLAGLIGS